MIVLLAIVCGLGWLLCVRSLGGTGTFQVLAFLVAALSTWAALRKLTSRQEAR